MPLSSDLFSTQITTSGVTIKKTKGYIGLRILQSFPFQFNHLWIYFWRLEQQDSHRNDHIIYCYPYFAPLHLRYKLCGKVRYSILSSRSKRQNLQKQPVTNRLYPFALGNYIEIRHNMLHCNIFDHLTMRIMCLL